MKKVLTLRQQMPATDVMSDTVPCYESEGEFVGAGSDLAGHTPRSFVSIMVLLLCLILSLD